MALPGAYLADLLLQTIGLGAIPLALVPTAWAWRIISHRGLPWIWLHLALLPLTLVLTAGSAASFATPAGWPLDTGLGGLIGGFVVGWLASLVGQFGGTLEAWHYRLGLGVGAAVALAFTFGVSPTEWFAVVRGMIHSLARMVTSIYRICLYLGHMFARRWQSVAAETAPRAGDLHARR